MRVWAWFTACQDNTACERLSSSRPSRLALRLRSGWALWLLKKHLLFFFSVPSWYSRSSICIPACFAGEASKHLRRIAMRTDASAVSSPPEPHLFGRQRRAECFGWNPAKMQAIDKNPSMSTCCFQMGAIFSTCTPRRLSTFISAVPLRAPPGRNCPTYSFNLARRVRTVIRGPISDDPQMRTYDPLSQKPTLSTEKIELFPPLIVLIKWPRGFPNMCY